MEIVFQQGILTSAEADAIVVPANSLGDMSRGIAALVRERGGAAIEQEAKEKSPTPLGEAVATAAGSLPFRYAIHAPLVAAPTDAPTIEGVRQATLAALFCADSVGVKILAFPSLVALGDSISSASAAEVMVETMRNYETASIRKVILIDDKSEIVEAFRNALLAERA
jgi:O-acetyl-ADP-ribose deacetylase